MSTVWIEEGDLSGIDDLVVTIRLGRRASHGTESDQQSTDDLYEITCIRTSRCSSIFDSKSIGERNSRQWPLL